MNDSEEFKRIILDYPDLLELALHLVIEQAQIYGLLGEGDHKALSVICVPHVVASPLEIGQKRNLN